MVFKELETGRADERWNNGDGRGRSIRMEALAPGQRRKASLVPLTTWTASQKDGEK
jgi:hypothetical protein